MQLGCPSYRRGDGGRGLECLALVMGKTGVPGATESHSLGQGSDPRSPLLGHEPTWGLLKVEGSPAEDF